MSRLTLRSQAFLGASLIVLGWPVGAMAADSGIKFDASGFLDLSAFSNNQGTSGFADPDQDGLGGLARHQERLA